MKFTSKQSQLIIVVILILAAGFVAQYATLIQLELTLNLGTEEQKRQLLTTVNKNDPHICHRLLQEAAKLTDRRFATPTDKNQEAESLIIEALNPPIPGMRISLKPVTQGPLDFEDEPKVLIEHALHFWESGSASYRAKTSVLARLEYAWTVPDNHKLDEKLSNRS